MLRLTFLALLFYFPSLSDGYGQSPPPPADKRLQSEWFYKPRALPDGSFPVGARARAITAASLIPSAVWQRGGILGFHPLGTQSNVTLPWTYAVSPPIRDNCPGTGPTCYGGGPWSLRVNTIAVSPSNTNTVFIGTSFGGIAESTDGGNTWTYLTDGLPSQSITHIVIDTTAPNIMYAGTGDPYYDAHGTTLLGVGIYRSADSGATWQQFAATSLGGAVVERILIDPATSGSQTGTILYAALAANTSNNGIWKSLNSGQTWSQIHSSEDCYDIVIDTTTPSFTPSKLYAACSSGFLKSTTGGTSWNLMLANPAAVKARVAMVGSKVFGTMKQDPAYGVSTGTLFSSSDGLASTTTLTQGFCGSQCFYDQYLAIDTTRPNRIFLGGVDASSSTNGGLTFKDYAPFNPPNMIIHSDHHALAFAPSNTNILYEGNDGGVYKSVDGGGTWSNLNANLPGALIVGVGIANDGHLVMGAQDNGSNVSPPFSPFPSTGWLQWTGGDGGFAKIDPGNSQVMYTTYVGTTSIYRTSNGGQTASLINPPNPATETSLFYPTLFMNPQNSNQVMVGYQNVYRTLDAGSTWTRIGASGSPDGSNNISALAQAPSNANVIYAATSGNKVFVTYNANNGIAADWWQITSGLPSGQVITGIAVDPSNYGTAYLTLSQYGTTSSPDYHVFKTTSAATPSGAVWANISAALPDVPFNDITLDVANSSNVYAASDAGVFSSADKGTTWVNLSSGLPQGIIVNSLSLSSATHELVAGTYGRGAYGLILPSTTTTASICSAGGALAIDAPLGPIQVAIPANAFAQCVTVTLSTPTSFPAAVSITEGLTPTGVGIQLNLSPLIQPSLGTTLSISYSPASVAGLDPSRFIIARYDTSQNLWLPLPSTPDPTNQRVTAQTNHFSLFQVMQASATASVSTIKVFPNPLRPAQGETTMTFTQLPAQTRIRIYTLNGQLVKHLTTDATGTAVWDATNQSGFPVASGVYFAFIQGAGGSRTYKVAIQR